MTSDLRPVPVEQRFDPVAVRNRLGSVGRLDLDNPAGVVSVDDSVAAASEFGSTVDFPVPDNVTSNPVRSCPVTVSACLSAVRPNRRVRKPISYCGNAQPHPGFGAALGRIRVCSRASSTRVVVASCSAIALNCMQRC